MLNRAYSVIEIKSIDEDRRIIKGIATTPTTDRMGDIVETSGIRFKLPLPFLYQHDAKNPIGWVTEAETTKDGIPFTAEILAAGLDSDVDKAWNKIKHKLVRGASIGFKTIKETFDKATKGFRIHESEWLELSAVTIPANAEATITSVKAFDIGPATSGDPALSITRLDSRQPAAVVAFPKGKTMTTAEQITQWDAKLVSTKAQAEAIMTKAADEQRVLSDEEELKHDELTVEVGKIVKHIDRLKVFEKTIAAKATPVTPEATATPEKAAEARQGIIQVKSMLPKGLGMARMALAVAGGAMTYQNPVEIAQRRWPDSPEVAIALKATIDAGDTTTSGWASQLVPSAVLMAEEFRGIYRPQTIIGRIPGLRRVPFNIAVPIETASGTAQWVGEGAPKPVTKLTLTSVTLRWAKAAAIVAITDELARHSTPDAEMVVRDSMVQTLVRFFDAYFVGAAAEVSNVAPAGILNGISSTAASSTTAAAFRTDMNNLLNNFTANNIPLSNIVLLMSSTQAVALSLMVTDLGVSLFSSITREGGSILGFPVIISEAVGTKIIALNVPDILLAEEPGVQVAISREASIEMSDTPIQGDQSPFTSAVLKSAFQNNLIFIRVEQYITWKAARSTGVEYITGNAYVP